MKTLMLCFFAAFALISCEDIETNNRALQVTLNNEFFKAADARAQINPDGTLTIQGLTDLETLTIHLNNSSLGVYTLDGSSTNRVIFEDFEGSVYTTNPFGNGQVVVEDISEGSFSGTFRFNAYRFGLDTLNGAQGIFYKVPLDSGSIEEDPEIPVNILSAKINDVDFSATTVTAVDSGNFILISGTQANTTIAFSFPNDLTNGNNPIATGNITALITIDGVQREAVSGNLSIVNHNLELNAVSGAFSFETAAPDGILVTQGQFNVSY